MTSDPWAGSPALAQFVVLGLEHVQFLGEADNNHEEQQHGERRGSDGDAHDLELGDDGLTASAFVPHIVLNVTPEEKNTIGEHKVIK